MGAVLHTLNIRLSHEQLVFVANHAGDRVVLVDDSLVPVIAPVASQLSTVEAWIVVGDGDATALAGTGRPVHRYHDLLAAEEPGFDYPEPDELAAASMCYTSGTTGDPKGVVYSHRSTYLHSLAVCTPSVLGLEPADRALAIVPQFHASGWGLPYAAFLSGASLLMPGRFLQAEPLARFIAAERPTVSAAVPTVWADLYRYGNDHDLDLSSLRFVACGGAALPRSLMERFQERDGLRLIQGWGMTEMSPVGAIGHPPAGARPGTPEEMDWRAKTGRVIPGVELRIVDDDGDELPWDGTAVGEIEVRGPWITASYWQDPAPEKFHDGWLRTGDVGTVTANGYMQITDRAKDVIKSGGEWISSVELENALDGPPRRRRGRGHRDPRPALGRTAAGMRRHRRRHRPGRRSWSSSPGTSPSGRCPRTGRSSTRSRRRPSASSTRRHYGRSTRRATSHPAGCDRREGETWRTNETFDVAIVGYGPVGAALAILLGQHGHRVVVLERFTEPYPLPRAVHYDHEVARILQSCGVAEQCAKIVEPAEVYEFRNAEGQAAGPVRPPGQRPVGLAPVRRCSPSPISKRCCSPGSTSCRPIEVRRGWPVTDLVEDGDSRRRAWRRRLGPGPVRRRLRRRQQHRPVS